MCPTHTHNDSRAQAKPKIISSVDRHRFDADPDPDPTFHFNVHPDPQVLHMLENLKLFPTLSHKSVSLHKLFILHVILIVF